MCDRCPTQVDYVTAWPLMFGPYHDREDIWTVQCNRMLMEVGKHQNGLETKCVVMVAQSRVCPRAVQTILEFIAHDDDDMLALECGQQLWHKRALEEMQRRLEYEERVEMQELQSTCEHPKYGLKRFLTSEVMVKVYEAEDHLRRRGRKRAPYRGEYYNYD
jgi:hypothetical protein